MIEKYILALVLTIVVETALGYLFGFKKLKHIAGFIFINFVTNIWLNIILIYNSPALIYLELIIVLTEAIFYGLLFKIKLSKALALSFILNPTTYILGLVLNL